MILSTVCLLYAPIYRFQFIKLSFFVVPAAEFVCTFAGIGWGGIPEVSRISCTSATIQIKAEIFIKTRRCRLHSQLHSLVQNVSAISVTLDAVNISCWKNKHQRNELDSGQLTPKWRMIQNQRYSKKLSLHVTPKWKINLLLVAKNC